MPAGRPKKTLKDLPQKWKTSATSLYKNGAADEEVIAALKISKGLFYRLQKDETDFSEMIEEGHTLSLAWWLRQGRTNLKGRDFNHGLWYMNMKNRFGWRDQPLAPAPEDEPEVEDLLRDFMSINAVPADQADGLRKQIGVFSE